MHYSKEKKHRIVLLAAATGLLAALSFAGCGSEQQEVVLNASTGSNSGEAATSSGEAVTERQSVKRVSAQSTDTEAAEASSDVAAEQENIQSSSAAASSSQTESDGGEAVEETLPAYAYYAPILSNLSHQIAAGNADDIQLNGIWEIVNYEENPASAITDINGDSIEELVVADIESTEAGNVLALYTLVDSEPTLVTEGWSRNRNVLLEDGSIYISGSSGAAYSAFGIFDVASDGSLKYRDFFFTDLDMDVDPPTVLLCHNTTGEWDTASSEILDMSEEDFWNIESEYQNRNKMAVEYTPFSQY